MPDGDSWNFVTLPQRLQIADPVGTVGSSSLEGLILEIGLDARNGDISRRPAL